MMEETILRKTSYQPKTMAELLPDLALKGIMSEDDILMLTAKKKPRQTLANNRTAERTVKPLTMAEMKAEIEALTGRTPARPKAATSTKKKGWNSSIKVDKKINHTGDGKMHNNVVRKVLHFQPPSRPAPPPQIRPTTSTRMTLMPPVPKTRMTMASAAPHRMTLMPAETPKVPKPEHRAKKSLYMHAKTSVRISGICNIPETPEETKPAKPRVSVANKENSSCSANINRKSIAPKLINHKKMAPPPVPDTPLSNDSDASFIQKEKEIYESEEKTNAILDSYPTLEKIAEVSPPVSTPFREYRQDVETLNNSSLIDTSNAENDTIMCFDNLAAKEAVNEREESVIVSLCDMLKKATVNNTETQTSELEQILQIEKQTRHNIKMINDGIQVLTNIRESQQKALEDIIRKKELFIEKRDGGQISGSDKDVTLVANNQLTAESKSPERSPVVGRQCSVIRASPKSPSYKIPKKTACLRKKVFYKSMPNDMSTPIKIEGGKALNMYLKMKEQLHFLNTPAVKARPAEPDTPAVTSQNLKMQLNKLYDES